MMSLKHLVVVVFLHLLLPAKAQLFGKSDRNTHADSVRGTLTSIRTCYDVYYYDLSVDVAIQQERIAGFNAIYFRAENDLDSIQIDLASTMEIDSITFENKRIKHYRRDGDAMILHLPHKVSKGEKKVLSVFYSGKPKAGVFLPWDGGFKWTMDEDGEPWVVVTCQGEGASLWWPCKDHQSDEPDSMSIRITVPDSLMEISNGRLREIKTVENNKKQYHWFVSNPINNYNVTINIGAFQHFNDLYISGNDTLTLDYYVKKQNLMKAKEQFKQVKTMLSCFEKFFGKYPFYRDGYKLVESPYLGMEHQSCIAYGNQYKKGYLGTDYSGIGINFDYIIIHESAHEWWGNAVTTKDIADMWVHEGFACYAEALYTECMYGKEKGFEYVNAQRRKVRNDKPVIGPYGVNKEGSGDMYSKGSLLLHTIRNYIQNDSLWFSILKGLQQTFAYQTVTTHQVEEYISKEAKLNLEFIFEQYLRFKNIPVFEYEITSSQPLTLRFRWVADVIAFNLPVTLSSNDVTFKINPSSQWQEQVFNGMNDKTFSIRDDLGYFKTINIK
jgi:aminopeptidase N